MTLDIHTIRARIRKPVPPSSVPPPLDDRGRNTETPSQAADREIRNVWLSEWNRDRKDLTAALEEIEVLRKSTAPELVALLRRMAKAKQSVDDVEQEVVDLLRRSP